jgi:hypothetical protein
LFCTIICHWWTFHCRKNLQPAVPYYHCNYRTEFLLYFLKNKWKMVPM